MPPRKSRKKKQQISSDKELIPDQETQEKPKREKIKLIDAHTITNKSLHKFPNIKHYLEILVKEADIKFRNVAEKPVSEDFSFDRIFINLFMRKHLANQFKNCKLFDGHTKNVLKKPKRSIIGTNDDLHQTLKEHYEVFRDPATQAMDIIEHIKTVALSRYIYFDNALPAREYDIDEDKLREMIKYFQNLPYKEVDFNTKIKCDYFYGKTDLIFDNAVIYDIKMSKFRPLDESKIPIWQFYHAIICGFGFYKTTGEMIKKFTIYNPIMGNEYSIELNNIDFEFFEKVIQRDVELYSRLNKFKEDNVVCLERSFLDRKLFMNNGYEMSPKRPYKIITSKPPSYPKEMMNISTIIHKSFKDFPNIKFLLETFVKGVDIKVKDVAKPGFCPDHAIYSIFINYFIQKHLSNQLNIEIRDRHTERILKNPDKYSIFAEKPQLLAKLIKHYEIFKDPKTQAIKIIKSIKIVSLSQQILLKRENLKTEYYVNDDKLLQVVKYFRKLRYKKVDLSPKVVCKYFYTYADLIFDDEVLYDIRISKFKLLKNNEPNILIKDFYKMIMYGFGYYKNFGKAIKQFKIYNPLYGYEYSIELNNIDFEFFEKVILQDIDAYCRLINFKEQTTVGLDRDLFINNGYDAELEMSPKIVAMNLKETSKPVPIVYQHYASFDDDDEYSFEEDDEKEYCSKDLIKSCLSTSRSAVSNEVKDKAFTKKSGTDRIRKWERCSREETVLLSKNRARKIAKRDRKHA